jgi:hypothetical protein
VDVLRSWAFGYESAVKDLVSADIQILRRKVAMNGLVA